MAMKIKLPRYAAPLYVSVPVALMRAPTPYVWTAEPRKDVPQTEAADAASLDLRNSSLEFARRARLYVSPKSGAMIASEAVWVKMVPRAMADGLTGGRSAIPPQINVVSIHSLKRATASHLIGVGRWVWKPAPSDGGSNPITSSWIARPGNASKAFPAGFKKRTRGATYSVEKPSRRTTDLDPLK